VSIEDDVRALYKAAQIPGDAEEEMAIEAAADRKIVQGRHPDVSKIRAAVPTIDRASLEALTLLLCAYIENAGGK
jgi:hypothetical protein